MVSHNPPMTSFLMWSLAAEQRVKHADQFIEVVKSSGGFNLPCHVGFAFAFNF